MSLESLAARAEVVLDPRLAEVWQLVWNDLEGEDEGMRVQEEVLGGLLRLAYLQGFADAKDEPVEGELYEELGIRSVRNSRLAAPRAARRRRHSSGR